MNMCYRIVQYSVAELRNLCNIKKRSIDENETIIKSNKEESNEAGNRVIA